MGGAEKEKLLMFLEESFSIGSPKYGAFSIGGTNIVDLSANLNVLWTMTGNVLDGIGFSLLNCT